MLTILVPLICVPVRAVDLEVDQSLFYQFAAPRIGTGDIFGTYFQYDGRVLKSINGIDVSTMNFAIFGHQYQRTLKNIQAAITASDTSLAAVLGSILERLDFYLPRLDASVDEVEGKLNNLYNGLSSIQSKQDAALNNFNAKFGNVFTSYR